MLTARQTTTVYAMVSMAMVTVFLNYTKYFLCLTLGTYKLYIILIEVCIYIKIVYNKRIDVRYRIGL